MAPAADIFRRLNQGGAGPSRTAFCPPGTTALALGQMLAEGRNRVCSQFQSFLRWFALLWKVPVGLITKAELAALPVTCLDGCGRRKRERVGAGGRRERSRGRGNWILFGSPRLSFLSISTWKSPRSYQRITSNLDKVQSLLSQVKLAIEVPIGHPGLALP